MIDARSWVVNEVVRFSYNGKNRVGRVEKLYTNAVCVQMWTGSEYTGYKSFSFDKIERSNETVPAGWGNVTA